MKLLIFTDDKVNRLFLKRDLDLEGFNVIEAEDRKDAIEKIKSQDIRMVLINLMNQNSGEMDICRKISDINLKKSIYKIIIIPVKNNLNPVKILDAGADDFIHKPFERNELLSRIKIGSRVIELEDKLRDSREKLVQLSREDPLTGVMNRRALLEELNNELNRVSRKELLLSSIIVDINNIKEINEKYGSPAGDLILIEFCSRLQLNCRPYDKIGRFGGKEFFIILPNTNEDNALSIAERMRSSVLEKNFKIRGKKINVKSNFGIFDFKPLGKNINKKDMDNVLNNVISAADKLLEKARGGVKSMEITYGNK